MKLVSVALILTAIAVVAIVSAAGPTGTLPADRTVPVRYVALGDSTVAGVGATSQQNAYVGRLHARLLAIYPATEMINLGVPGATSADVVREQAGLAVAYAPELITLSVGPNDITQRLPVVQFERNLDTLFRRLRVETTAVIVATLLPDLGITPRFQRAPEREAVSRASRAFNDALRRQARVWSVTLVDLHEPSQAEVPRNRGLVAADGYHPSDAGYARWADLMWTAIVPLIPAAR